MTLEGALTDDFLQDPPLPSSSASIGCLIIQNRSMDSASFGLATKARSRFNISYIKPAGSQTVVTGRQDIHSTGLGNILWGFEAPRTAEYVGDRG